MDLFPDTPAEVIALRELEERIGQVIDWAYDEVALASHRRSHEYGIAMKSSDFYVRQFMFLKIDKRYFSRLKDIEETESAYTQAYREAKENINHEPMLEHAIRIMPIVDAREKDILRSRAQRKMNVIDERLKLNEEKKSKKKSRELASGETSGRDGSIPKADRQEETSNERTGD